MIPTDRPRYLNLMQIRLPVPALVSILHRISGFGMFAFAWALLWLLQLTLDSPGSFARASEFAGSWIGKIFLIGIGWAFMHHFFAGLRFLLLDAHIGTELQSARRSSWVALVLGIVGTLVLGARLW
jgi:succinate dehydrogenase cytochrome b subunit